MHKGFLTCAGIFSCRPIAIATAVLSVVLAIRLRAAAAKGAEHDNSPGMIPHLTGVERELYRAGRKAFSRVNSVQGDAYVPNTEVGLGPLFNGDSCGMCHAYPALGGSSPEKNPQIEAASRQGARNRIPLFIRPDGPVLQARLKSDFSGASDGSVHPLFTIAGRVDAGVCQASPKDFGREIRNKNVVFRIPPPVFGAGLIEAIPDSEIEANAQRDSERKRHLGIHGHPNRVRADGSIGRFGWKAHSASLEAFAAEAYAVEQGVTNELFPQERDSTSPNCLINALPEDRFSSFSRLAMDAMTNVSRTAYFMRFLAPMESHSEATGVQIGRDMFLKIGCAECHTPVLKTGKSSHPALNEQRAELYSDLLVHHMGSALADGIYQETAASDEFRSAPLWGLRSRLFFLHDGRTRSLSEAIVLHSSTPYHGQRSEADLVIARYRRLPQNDKDALLQFLKQL